MASQNLRTLQDLRKNGPPQLFEADVEPIKQSLIAKYAADTNKTLFEMQPEMLLIELASYALSVLGEAAQRAVLNNTAVWAEGLHLENKGANVSIFRLLPQPARAVFKFSRERALPIQTIIPKGTRLSGVDQVFALEEDVIIASGALEATGNGASLTVGPQANEFPAFTINEIIDAVPDGIAGFNITTTEGGSGLEDQERFRGRVVNGNFRISKGGPRNGFREIVKGIHPDIVDVGVVRPQPCYIDIYALTETGAPGDNFKAFILDNISQENDVPMGDFITMRDPIGRDFDFTVIIRIDAADPTVEDASRQKINEIFYAWSRTMGVRVSPSVITSQLRSIAGVVDAETDLSYTDLSDTEFARLGNWNVDVRVTPNV